MPWEVLVWGVDADARPVRGCGAWLESGGADRSLL